MTKRTVPMVRASDATSWLICERRAYYDHFPTENRKEIDPFDALVMEMGVEHERHVMSQVGRYEEAVDEAHTQWLMNRGERLIYQGTVVDDVNGVVIKPDLLQLQNGDYAPVDIKMAGDVTAKKDARLQVAVYEHVLGNGKVGRIRQSDGQEVEIEERDCKLARQFIQRMKNILQSDKPPAARFVASKCKGCPFAPTCVPEFEANDEITRNYFVDVRAVERLADQGISTMTDLAARTPQSIEPIAYLKKETLRRNAVLQARSMKRREVIQIGTPDFPNGTAVHFDVETWPFGAEGGTVYLWGFLVPGYGKQHYEYVWGGQTQEEDEAGWLTFLATVDRYRSQFPDVFLVHYTPFELTQISRYATRYDMREDDTVKWLLDEEHSCFDIKPQVSNNLILPVTGYGLKDICKPGDLVNFQWELSDSGSQWSVVRFHHWLKESDPRKRDQIKEELLSYNRDDVRATRAVEIWLQQFASRQSTKQQRTVDDQAAA